LHEGADNGTGKQPAAKVLARINESRSKACRFAPAEINRRRAA